MIDPMDGCDGCDDEPIMCALSSHGGRPYGEGEGDEGVSEGVK